jgi:hypothetical protein
MLIAMDTTRHGEVAWTAYYIVYSNVGLEYSVKGEAFGKRGQRGGSAD